MISKIGRNRERGDVDVGLVVSVLVIAGLLSAFLFVKDWIKDTKDRRHGQGAYADIDNNERAPLNVNRGVRGYVVTFHP